MNARELAPLVRRKLPLTTLGIAVVGWWLLANGITVYDVFGPAPNPFNPLLHPATAVFHSGWAHYWGNIRLLVPAGILLTLLTSDEHVLGLAVVAHGIGSILYAVGGGLVVGSSGVVFAVFAALIVRSTGDAMQDQPANVLVATAAGLLAPFAVVLYVLVIAVDFGQIAHMGHFMAFAWGALYELGFVLVGHAQDDRVVLTL